MSTVSEPLASKIQEAGWLPGKRLENGEGGGGQVFRAVNVSLLNSLLQFMRNSGGVSLPPGVREANCVDLVEKLHASLILNRDLLAVLKIPKRKEDPTVNARLKREIAGMKAVSHPALVKLLDFDKSDKPEWFVMEYHPRGSLNDVAVQYKGKVLDSLLDLRPVVEGVSLLHGQNYVHRDIKPNNIFISADSRLVLGDFGIIFPADEQGERLTVHPGEMLSRDWAPDWMRFTDSPPEALDDVFMLAKVLYFMVTGGKRVVASHLDEEQFDLRRLFPNIKGISALHDFLSRSIVTRKRDCGILDAGKLLEEIDEVIGVISDQRPTQLLFNFLATHSSSEIAVLRPGHEGSHSPNLLGLQIYLSSTRMNFIGKARVTTPNSETEVTLSFSIDKNLSNNILVRGPRQDAGVWSPEIKLTTQGVTRGWHTLNIRATSPLDGGRITAFMLYGE